MKRVTAVDAFKLLFAYCVVAIHTQFLSTFNHVIVLEMLFSMAVPFFFISSGYFFQSKLNRNSGQKYRGGYILMAFDFLNHT